MDKRGVILELRIGVVLKALRCGARRGVAEEEFSPSRVPSRPVIRGDGLAAATPRPGERQSCHARSDLFLERTTWSRLEPPVRCATQIVTRADRFQRLTRPDGRVLTLACDS